MEGPRLSAGSYHVAIVVDDRADTLSLYVNGAFVAGRAFSGTLAKVSATTCFLGRSNDATDPYFGGVLDEFRIFDDALTASALAFSYEAGPEASSF